MALFALQSCVDNKSTFPDEANVYYGTLTVGDYTEDMVGISVTENLESTAVDIFFDDVKFAKAMPVRVDITAKDVPCRREAEILHFSAENIDPYMNREEKPQRKYRFSEISGTVIGNELVLSARMEDEGKGDFVFRGVYKAE